jgi:Ser/Thr protein kinase RdoA (MazF antagonist)
MTRHRLLRAICWDPAETARQWAIAGDQPWLLMDGDFLLAVLQHHVEGITVDALEQGGWLGCVSHQMAKILKRQKGLAQARDAHIAEIAELARRVPQVLKNSLVLKGLFLGPLYRHRSHRMLSDIDLVIESGALDTLRAALLAQGYWEKDVDRRRSVDRDLPLGISSGSGLVAPGVERSGRGGRAHGANQVRHSGNIAAISMVEADEHLVVDLLSRRYGLACTQLARLPIGHGTINYRAEFAGQTLFVKQYLPRTDLAAEREAIHLSELARSSGIPAAPIFRNVDGDVIDQAGRVALSVWTWMPGAVQTEGLSSRQFEQVGATLGRIHRLFAPLPASNAPAFRAQKWRDISVDGLNSTIDHLQMLIRRRIDSGVDDAFDRAAVRQLYERKAMISRIPGLLATIPDLASQVIHGDYSLVNLLFEARRLTAVLDFRPAEPFLIAYDLGRIAFSPSTVVTNENWIDAAGSLVAAYIEENPNAPRADIHYCCRVALLQLLKSLYGVKQHYLEPSLLQEELDRFWSLRHASVTVLFAHLEEVEALFADLAQARP